ncbi:nucleotidyltransferase [Roseivirga sp.]|uniref:nucleotidyltransferase n=1 Tax=Roseivirga sp. TaxID=1964215 RepID=UPI002B2752B4|nr:nucleotidyltransferase [Roseivirga sp.]
MINNEIRTALKNICSTLNQNKVEYLIIGGVAVSYYGYYRISAMGSGMSEVQYDIDFWYNPTTSNFHNLLKSLKDIGIDISTIENTVFDRNQFLRIPHKHFRMEFLPQMIGLETFSTCFKRAQEVSLDDNNLHFLSYNDLILNKRAVGRGIDKEDIEALGKIRNQRDQPD